MHAQRHRSPASRDVAVSRPPDVPVAPHPAPPDALGGLLARAVAKRTLARATIKNGSAKFEVSPYRKHLPKEDGKDTARKVGVEVGIKYTPAKGVYSDKIAFVQTMKTTKDGAAYLFANETPRATDVTSGEAGWVVDRLAGRDSPIYGQDDDGTASGTITFGYNKKGRWFDKVQKAKMEDYVELNRAQGQTVTVDAVTWAFDETGGRYLGGVFWGFSTDAGGTTTLTRPGLFAAGNPSGVHRAALVKWNEQSLLDDVNQRNSPTQARITVPD